MSEKVINFNQSRNNKHTIYIYTDCKLKYSMFRVKYTMFRVKYTMFRVKYSTIRI